ncbi:hypothetical protein KCV87_01385 [Actinosynnema pretiosum subsp. pretiosum]|uniref:Uncharacterized protein n=1 Tax=Actinosynnema pretiosum subsp. pretiosum TaxID=103721 RepID=A0AA45L7Y0_9PSEU|nr:hypothetical protein APASM_3732 [Actinosynnema pretiosum subsp. pretiosum]QUF04820.1 hypothetical protein KCV87_01385 [Actinosynnema pretiosum subsp. pretiosum]
MRDRFARRLTTGRLITGAALAVATLLPAAPGAVAEPADTSPVVDAVAPSSAQGVGNNADGRLEVFALGGGLTRAGAAA